MTTARRLVLAAAASAGLFLAVPCRAQECVTALNRWTRLSDDALPPAFLTRGAKLPVERVLVCDDRVHFFLRAREAHGVVDFCLVLFAPQPEDVARFYDHHGESGQDPVARVRDMAEDGARAREDFLAFKDGLREVLGKRYVEGKTIPLARERYRAELDFSGRITFTWRRREVAFAGWFLDVYRGPDKSLSPAQLFILFYPR